MKTLSLSVVGCLLAAYAAAGPVSAPAPADHPGVAPKQAFESLKSLAGSWEGAAKGEAPKPHVTYRVTAAGTAVEEALLPGTPHEMITMYHMDGDDLVLTHYCAAGNQPHMKLNAKASTPKELVFEFAGGTNITDAGLHMHAVKIRLVDADHIESEWTAHQGGKAASTESFALARQK